MVGLHRGLEGLTVFSGEFFGGFPEEVSDVAIRGQAAQRRVVDALCVRIG